MTKLNASNDALWVNFFVSQCVVVKFIEAFNLVVDEGGRRRSGCRARADLIHWPSAVWHDAVQDAAGITEKD